MLRHPADPGPPALLRSARSDQAGVDAARTVRIQWPLHQAALCESVAQAASEAASANLARRRRIDRDLEVRDRQRLHLQLPEFYGPQVRQGADGWLLELGRE